MKIIIEVPPIDIRLHVAPDARIDEILKQLAQLRIQGEQLRMALNDAEQNIVTEIKDAISAVGDRISALIAAGPTDNPDFLTQLQAEADQLKALGTPAVPVTPPADPTA